MPVRAFSSVLTLPLIYKSNRRTGQLVPHQGDWYLCYNLKENYVCSLVPLNLAPACLEIVKLLVD